MKTPLAFAALGLALVAGTGAAQACPRGPRPQPVIPEPHDALLVAVAPPDIARPPGATGERWPLFRVETVLDGGFAAGSVAIRQALAPASGEEDAIVMTGCGAPPADTILLGQELRAGQKILVVLRGTGRESRAISWTPLETAAGAEPFVARSLAARNDRQRQRLAWQWREARRRPGPVPLTDPSRWFAFAPGGLEPVRSGLVTAVEFDVADDGGVTNCRLAWSSAPASRDRSICPALVRGHRFAPPLRYSERHGLYEVRWTAPPAQ
jgi:hypothetical protein